MAIREFGRPSVVGEWISESKRLRPPVGNPFWVKYAAVGVGITGMLLFMAAL